MSMQHKAGEHSRRPAGDGAGQRLLAGRPVEEATAQARQPRPVLVALAAAGILGPAVFAVVAVVQGLLRPGYSFVAHPVVVLVAGASGWAQDLNFVVLGAAMIAFATGLQLGVRPTRWAVAGPGLFALSGIGPLWAGLAGPRPGHFLLTFLAAATGLIILSRPMARNPSWQRLAGYTLITGIAILVVIPIHSLLALPTDAPLHPVVGPVQLVGDHPVAHLHRRPRPQTPTCRQSDPGAALIDHDARNRTAAEGHRLITYKPARRAPEGDTNG